MLEKHKGYAEAGVDRADRDGVAALFAAAKPEAVVNLAAQAGVRYSLESPRTYVDSNAVGFLNLHQGCRAFQPKHMVFPSTSSAYGAHVQLQFNVHHAAPHPLTYYPTNKPPHESH